MCEVLTICEKYLYFRPFLKITYLLVHRVKTQDCCKASLLKIGSNLLYYNWNQILPPANEVCKGHVLHLSVSHSVHRGVVCSVYAGIHPPPRSRQPSWKQTPTWRQSPPEADTPLGKQTPPGEVHAGRYGQQASGTHPTGMYTCLGIKPVWNQIGMKSFKMP